MNDSTLRLSSGRDLAFVDMGEPEWPCAFFFHGAPSSRLRLTYLEAEFGKRRIRLISPDRPGYGCSSPQPGRTMSDWPADVEALADALGITRFMVAGHSSGGPYALACASAPGDRVTAAIVLGGVTDMAWPEAWKGYPESEQRLMRAGNEDEAVALCAAMFGSDGRDFGSASGFEFAEPDEKLYADAAVAARLTEARVEAFRQGVAGYAQDIFVQGRAWPFDAQDITAPVRILHGKLDTLLPRAHSEHTAELVRNSELRVLADHGHLSILNALPTEILDAADPRR